MDGLDMFTIIGVNIVIYIIVFYSGKDLYMFDRFKQQQCN